MLDDLKELMEIESVMSAPEDGAPFGKNLRKTLDLFLEKAASYGMKTENMGGYCGYAEIGSGKSCIGILCHLDVVPAGDGWSYPPYSLTLDGGYLYGRGVADDKGPAIAALHVLKRLKDENVKLNHRVRLIVGCNEENGSACMKHYVGCGEIPAASFVPDSDFPIIGSEKGILHLKISLPADKTFNDNVEYMSAGNRPNVVPDKAVMRLKNGGAAAEKIREIAKTHQANAIFCTENICKALLGGGINIDDLSARLFENYVEVEARGIAGHAMAPEKGDNAIFKLFTFLNALICPESGETIETINRLLCSPLSAERLGIACKDERSGALTINFGAVKFENNKLILTLDLRLPLCANKDDVINKIMSALPKNARCDVMHHAKNLYADENGALVKTLLGVYASVTGNETYIVKSGGGTYARELPNAVAFGPTFPNAETFIHNADERLKLEDLNKVCEIYYQAVIALDKAIK